MISAADFTDVFPSMAKRKLHQRDDMTTENSRPNSESRWDYFMCISQWEDDGGNAWTPLHPHDEA